MIQLSLVTRTYGIDIGCSNHMCEKKEMFVDLDEVATAMAKFGDDRKILVKGKGNIVIRTRNEDHLIISDVYYVPS